MSCVVAQSSELLVEKRRFSTPHVKRRYLCFTCLKKSKFLSYLHLCSRNSPEFQMVCMRAMRMCVCDSKQLIKEFC